ncbi:MAG: DUF1349 domain-containing protein, partial [Gammaproteobacteria bacterium]
TTTAYGSTGSNPSPVTAHSVTLTGLNPNTLYHYRASSTDGSGNTASSGDMTFTTSTVSSGSPSGMVSDNFTGALNTSIWAFHDPKGDSSVSTTGTQASISVPAGSAHDLWTNALNAPRIRQAVTANTDFEVEAKFDSAVTNKYQLQGLTVEQDNNNLIRYDIYFDGSTVQAFSAIIVNGKATKKFGKSITPGVPMYLRVSRVGNQWTMAHSYNGINWTTDGTYSHTLSVTEVGLFAGNAGSPVPAHSVLVESFVVDGITP